MASSFLPIIFQIADSLPGYGRDALIMDIKPFVREKVYFTQKEIAARYKVTLDCVKQWCRGKKLCGSLKVPGGTVRYTLADLDRFEELTGRTEEREGGEQAQ